MKWILVTEGVCITFQSFVISGNQIGTIWILLSGGLTLLSQLLTLNSIQYDIKTDLKNMERMNINS